VVPRAYIPILSDVLQRMLSSESKPVFVGAQTLAENAKTIGLTIQGSVYPLYLFGKAGTGDLPALLLVAVVVLVIFALACLLLSRSFLKMATMVTSVSTKSVRKTKLEASSVSMALLKKELDHFFNNATYIMNCGEGLILLPLAGLAVLIKGREFVPMLQTAPLFESGLVAAGISCLIAMLAGMNNIAEPSVSMDAKQMWLLKSLPLTPWQMLRAKMESHWVLTGLPVLFCCCLYSSPIFSRTTKTRKRVKRKNPPGARKALMLRRTRPLRSMPRRKNPPVKA